MKTILFVKSYYGILPENMKCQCIDSDAKEWIDNGYAIEIQPEKNLGAYVKSYVDIQVRAIKRNKLASYIIQFNNTFEEAKIDPKRGDIYKAQRYEIVSNYILDEYSIKTIRDATCDEYWYRVNNIYVPNAQTIIEEVAHIFYKSNITQEIINKIQLLIRVKTFIDRDLFFQGVDQTHVAVANGVLNLQTRTLLDEQTSINSFIFNLVPIKYLPEQDCPNFKQFIKDILLNEDDIKTVQELFGFCLLPHYKYEKLFILTGNGRNGKSKLLQVLKTIVGQHNTVSHGLKTIQEKDFAVSDLHCKLANIGGDISSGALKDTDVIKQITGQDLITANRKFKSYVRFVNYSKQVFACNELPTIYDSSLGFWNRIIKIDFPFTFYEPKEYEGLADKTYAKIRKENVLDNILTEKELSGVLNWALEGLQRLYIQSQFSNTADTLKVRNSWIRKSSSFYAFIEDLFVFDPNSKIENGTLNDLYSAYCEYMGYDIVDSKLRREQVNTYANKAISIVVNRDLSGNNVRYWKGIKFNDKVKDFLLKSSNQIVTDDNIATLATRHSEKLFTTLLLIGNYLPKKYVADVADEEIPTRIGDIQMLSNAINKGNIAHSLPLDSFKAMVTEQLFTTLFEKGIISINGQTCNIKIDQEVL